MLTRELHRFVESDDDFRQQWVKLTQKTNPEKQMGWKCQHAAIRVLGGRFSTYHQDVKLGIDGQLPFEDVFVNCDIKATYRYNRFLIVEKDKLRQGTRYVLVLWFLGVFCVYGYMDGTEIASRFEAGEFETQVFDSDECIVIPKEKLYQ